MHEQTTAVLPFMAHTLLATAAYLFFCLCVAQSLARQTSCTGPAATSTTRHKYRAYLAVFTALFSFSCVPLGSLPALVPTNAALLAMGSVGISLGCDARTPLAIKQHQGISLVLLLIVLLRLAAYAMEQGIPGDIFSFDPYVATPLLGVISKTSLAGFLLLALAAFPPPPCFASLTTAQALACTLRQLFFLACWACLFIPTGIATSLAPYVNCAPSMVFLVDACYFWLKIYALFVVAWLLGRVTHAHAGRWHRLRIACVMAGLALL